MICPVRNLQFLFQNDHSIRRTLEPRVLAADPPLERANKPGAWTGDALGGALRAYAEDADHGDPVADMADEFHRARGPAHGGGDRR